MRIIKVGAGLSLLLWSLLFALPAEARVSGACANCHTMHNSQDGSVVDAGGPSANLLASDCVGCHSSSDTSTILTLGSTRVPIVYNIDDEPTYPADGSVTSALAGGNFYWVAHNGDAYGHNVFGISGVDGDLDHAPGPSTTCYACHDSLATNEPENGCKGCHVPHHHADDSAVVVGEPGGWYRFLSDNPAMLIGDPVITGVTGIEEEDWEQNPAANNHNVYMGTDVVYEQTHMPYMPDATIGQFCAGCHGNFHHSMNEAQAGDPTSVAGAWIRHPSDVLIPASGEYDSYDTYNPLAPAARTSVVAGDVNFTTIDHTRDVVTCISCHRAHGSPYPDMLRWDYLNACNAGTADADCGCFTCHTTKD